MNTKLITHFYQSLFCVSLISLSCWNLQAQSNTAKDLEGLEQQAAELRAQQTVLNQKIETIQLKKIREDLQTVGLPTVPGTLKNEQVQHGGLILGYNEAYEQANWVAHIIIPKVNEGKLTRTNDFRRDSLVSTGTAVKADYWYSGYDRGHLAPSADFKWSARAISESYVYSNMAPQRPELNRERWADLERFARNYVWAKKRDLCVVTGPIFTDDMESITQGPNVVAIPKHFYKILLDYSQEKPQGIAFILPNTACPKSLISYATTIDAVEEKTGLDFFPKLPKDLQDKLEQQSNFGDWEGMEAGEIATQKPLGLNERPKNTLNSVEAELFVNKKACVCGLVVSTRKTAGGSIFFNLDAKFPNHTFSGSIWASNVVNFSYDPEIELLGKKICITGKITEHKGKPTMTVEHEKRLDFLDASGKRMP